MIKVFCYELQAFIELLESFWCLQKTETLAKIFEILHTVKSTAQCLFNASPEVQMVAEISRDAGFYSRVLMEQLCCQMYKAVVALESCLDLSKAYKLT